MKEGECLTNGENCCDTRVSVYRLSSDTAPLRSAVIPPLFTLGSILHFEKHLTSVVNYPSIGKG